MTDSFDIAVIGAGIAGASIGAECAGHASVLIAEAEDVPGYHTTGRSAAFWEECYGGPDIVPLTLASGPYLREFGALATRGALYVARAGQEEAVESFLRRFEGTGVTIERIAREQLAAIVPGLRGAWTEAISEPACADIDVAAVHQHYLALGRQRGAELRLRHRLVAANREGGGEGECGGWRLDFGPAGEVRARILVDAAGAWADAVAELAGIRPLGIAPLRRTIAQLRVEPPPPADLPLVLDLNGEFYFRPEGKRLWLSPLDETPSEPCDAAAEEWDVALAIERFEQVVDWRVAAVESKWAGLRSFAPDRRPVYGYDPACAGFFWFAGQGGFGIQTAPAAARLAAQALLHLPRDAMTGALDASLYSPARFTAASADDSPRPRVD